MSKKLAQDLIDNGQPAQALQHLEVFCKDNPIDEEAWNMLGMTHARMKAYDSAEECFRKVIRLNPYSVPANSVLADILAMKHQYREAIHYYNQSLSLDEHQPNVCLNLGNCLQQERRIEEAIDAYLQALQLNPNLPAACRNLGLLYIQLHKPEDARRYAEMAIQFAPFDVESHILIAKLDASENKLDKARHRLEWVLENKPRPFNKAIALIELGSIFDKLGEFTKAFDYITEAKQHLKSINNIQATDLAAYRENINNYRTAFTERLTTGQKTGYPHMPANILVFLVGFPRSGTTLTEQILEAHPAITSTHELPALIALTENIASIIDRPFSYPTDICSLNRNEVVMLRRAYWRLMEENMGSIQTDIIILDKLPLNIVHLGFIAHIFPEAKVLIAHRDPRDVCLSCYMQAFHMNPAMAQFLDIEDTGKFYATVMGLWLHYRKVLGTDYLETRYEDIVDDLEGSARRLLKFIGIGWDQKVLDYHNSAKLHHVHTPSYQGVTQPIYNSSIAKWRHYQQQIRPILPGLEPFICEYGYQPE